jgi:hypothetical protein
LLLDVVIAKLQVKGDETEPTKDSLMTLSFFSHHSQKIVLIVIVGSSSISRVRDADDVRTENE